jgi:DNA mismatch repair protein MutS
MAFLTDQQTLDDLNIFGRRGGDSVYEIFNRTITRHGAVLLEDMFRHPLSDVHAIRQRTALFEYFLSAGAIFPFRSELFDIAEAYLTVTDERTRLSTEQVTLGNKLTRLVAEDNEYKTIYKGITALMEIVQDLYAFMAALPLEAPTASLGSSVSPPQAASVPFREEKEAIRSLLAEEDLQTLLKEDLKSKLPFTRIAAYDSALRFRHRASVRRLLRYIYRLDVYISVGKVAAERHLIFPLALPSEQHRVLLQDVYHPQVKNAVPNNLDITADHHVLFLTGANMAGKSTFMKTVSIALFLAHMGFPVPARRMEFSVLDGIYTTINLSDNLGAGASHFYAEVLRIKKVAKELSANKNLFVLFDELFRGTNVKDAYEGTVAITKAFAGRRNSIFVISTHIIEAGEILRESVPAIRFLYLPTRMEHNTPVYTYILEEGITDDRHGMVIIHNEGILEILKSGKREAGRPKSGGAKSYKSQNV